MKAERVVRVRPPAEEYERLVRARIDHLVEVREPLVLTSQIQRSGGTLLSQLLDGHPEVHAHPSEIYIGHPKKWNWPELDLARPETWFDVLYERPVELHLRDGYVKEKEARLVEGHEVHPFVFMPELQRRIFDACIAKCGARTERDVLDCYFTSYFNAWLDNQNLYAGPKKAVTGFTPRLASELGNVQRFVDDYPDGMLVAIVRDPRGWYESARRYRPYYEDVEQALPLWRASTDAALEAAQRWPDQVVVLTYEQLVLETEATMRLLAARIGLSWSAVLLAPTFNGRPIAANSSARAQRHGVVRERARAYAESLAPGVADRVAELAGDAYSRAEAARLS